MSKLPKNAGLTTPRIAVIDGGWSPQQPSPRVVIGPNFAEAGREADSMYRLDGSGHGRQVMYAVTSLAPHAEVTAIQVFGKGVETSPNSVIRALRWIKEHEFDVVNMSLATVDAASRDALYLLCHDLAERGVTLVAACRNGRNDGFPALFDGVIGVAVDQNAKVPIRCQPIGGPDILLARGGIRDPNGKWAVRILSTSIATAVVSAMVSRALARCGRIRTRAMCDEILTEYAVHAEGFSALP